MASTLWALICAFVMVFYGIYDQRYELLPVLVFPLVIYSLLVLVTKGNQLYEDVKGTV